jgi:ferric-dicitrate binding protein FerR (iron transport regulator)
MNHQDLEKYSKSHYQKDSGNDESFEQFYQLTGCCKSINPDLRVAWEKIERKLDSSDRSRRRSIKLLSYAASIVVFVGMGLLAMYFFNSYDTNIIQSGREVESHELPDGSIVRLDKNSSIVYEGSFGQDDRELHLKGQAYFDVTKDDIPFSINTSHGSITVLGTVFNVKEESKSLNVVVEEGKVQVDILDQKVTLTRNEAVTYDSKSRKIAVDRNVSLNSLYWATGNLKFEDTAMDEVVKTLSESFDVKIEIVSKDLARCRLTGSFSNDSLDTILEKISTVLDVKIDRSDEKIMLTGKGC